MQPLIVYGVSLSQPVRAVLWLLLMKRAPFELRLINPGSKSEKGSRHPDYLAKSPGGTVPCIEEADGFTLSESHAIMAYLCRSRGWSDLYPDDDRQRARIDAYLHYHQRYIREASLGLVAPSFRKDLEIPQVMQERAAGSVGIGLRTINDQYLDGREFLLGDAPTIADISAYAEIGQLQPQFTNVFDLTPYPEVCRWLENMQQLDFHDEVHVVLKEIGDISTEAPSMETIVGANKLALKSLQAVLADF